jgi:hypothetical protein
MICNGSWKETAKDIQYNGNILECKLKRINEEYIYDRLRFLPNYQYHNIDGKFEWDNCKNNVELNNFTHEHISRRYKKISIQQCLENITNEYDEWFEIEETFINCIKDKCISISLFKKNVENTYNNQYNVDYDKWINKYYKSLIENLNTFNTNNICVNLYLANDLKNYIPELSKYKFLNIFLMKSSSIGAQPGTLWRFINITNKSYKKVFIADIDEKWDWVNYCDIKTIHIN